MAFGVTYPGGHHHLSHVAIPLHSAIQEDCHKCVRRGTSGCRKGVSIWCTAPKLVVRTALQQVMMEVR